MRRATPVACAALFFLFPSLVRADPYEPSAARVYGGPIVWAPFDNNAGILAVGGTLAAQWYPEVRRVLLLGVRLALLDNLAGPGAGYYGGFAIAEVGARPRIVSGHRNAFALVVEGGIGGAFIACPCSAPTMGYLYLAAHAGVGFDASAFTMNVLVGAATLAGGGAVGAVDGLAELGVRF